MNTQNIRYLNKEHYIQKVNRLNDIYWSETFNGRWNYLSVVINQLKLINPQTVLELGAYKINLTNISDNMDLELSYIDPDNISNKTYIQDATSLPWDIPDKYYDVFVALQVFEHFENQKQSEVFNEAMRISKNVILSLPYKWNKPDDLMHHMIDDKKIKKWTNSAIPEKIVYINVPKKRRRVIYTFKF